MSLFFGREHEMLTITQLQLWQRISLLPDQWEQLGWRIVLLLGDG